MQYATVNDVRLRWEMAPASDDLLNARINDASIWLQAMYPKIPDRPSERLTRVLRMIVCAMVKRSLLADGSEHVESQSMTAGVFSQSQSFRNPEGNLYLTAQEKDMLESALSEETGSSRGMVTLEALGG